MAASLRVNPDVMKSTATELGQVGSAVTAVQPGQHLADLPSAMAGLSSATAFANAATSLDTATGRVGEDLTTFSSKVSRAMQTYVRADGQLADDVDGTMPDDVQFLNGPGEPTDVANPDDFTKDYEPPLDAQIAEWNYDWQKNQAEIARHNAEMPPPNRPELILAYNAEADALNAERAKLLIDAGEIFTEIPAEAENREANSR